MSLDSKPPPCRVCGKVEPVICYREEAPHLAVCPDCCGTAEHPDGETGHVWEHDRYERDHVCDRCGIPRRCTDYDDRD